MKYLIAILFVSLFSCKKESSNITTARATIYYSDPAVDGCGWTVIKDNQTYDPDNLSSAFKQSGLKIIVTYETDKDSTHCGIGNMTFPKMQILTIKKQ